MEKVNLAQKLSLLEDYWRPRIVGELNGFYVKVVKLKGEFVWHHHEKEDEMFLVVKGSLVIRLREGELHLEEGEFAIIPRGVDHKPEAARECHVVLFEPTSTVNAGSAQSDRTTVAEWI